MLVPWGNTKTIKYILYHQHIKIITNISGTPWCVLLSFLFHMLISDRMRFLNMLPNILNHISSGFITKITKYFNTFYSMSNYDLKQEMTNY